MKEVAIIGSTGSIGTQALQVVDAHPDLLHVSSVCANRNVKLVCEQAWKYRPRLVGITDEEAARSMPALPPECRFVTGARAAEICASEAGAEIALIAVVGIAGLPAVIAALDSGAKVALANKEALITGGALVKEHGGTGDRLLTVDSEHSAVWQCLRGLRDKEKELSHIILTASGGPFRTWSKERIDEATVADALKHPTWNMGSKITVDSAMLMNKGLEVIEARWLFEVDPSQIKVLIHPQSIVHSMIACTDNAVMAQLSVPDMCLPIQYALMEGERISCPLAPLDLAKVGTLTFEEPDTERFPCLSHAYKALEMGGMAPVVLNGANEIVVDACLKGRMKLSAIPYVTGEALAHFRLPEAVAINDVYEADREVRAWTLDFMERMGNRFANVSVGG